MKQGKPIAAGKEMGKGLGRAGKDVRSGGQRKLSVPKATAETAKRKSNLRAEKQPQ